MNSHEGLASHKPTISGRQESRSSLYECGRGDVRLEELCSLIRAEAAHLILLLPQNGSKSPPENEIVSTGTELKSRDVSTRMQTRRFRLRPQAAFTQALCHLLLRVSPRNHRRCVLAGEHVRSILVPSSFPATFLLDEPRQKIMYGGQAEEKWPNKIFFN
jgi:hypothetical protein